MRGPPRLGGSGGASFGTELKELFFTTATIARYLVHFSSSFVVKTSISCFTMLESALCILNSQ